MNIPSMLKRVGMLAAGAAAGGALPGIGGVGSVLLAGMKDANKKKSSNAGAMASKSNADGSIDKMYGQEFKKKLDYLFAHPEDRLENKRIRKEEEAASKRLGATIPAIRLLKSSPSQLISNTTSIANNTGILMVQLMQLNTRYVIAISNALGASVDRIFSEKEGKNGILAKISKSLDKNPFTGTIKKSVQHAFNFLDILNPFSLSKKFTNFFQGFGESIQKLILGEEGFKNLRNPNRVLKKAGLELADSKKTVNLLKVIAEVNIKQLDVLNDLRNVFRRVSEAAGHKIGYEKLDMTFDEFSGTLMSTADASRRRMSRERQYKDAYREGFSGGVGGVVGKAISLPMMLYKNRKSVRDNPNVATQRDRILVEELFINGLLEDIFLGEKYGQAVKQLLHFKPGKDVDISEISDREIKLILKLVEQASRDTNLHRHQPDIRNKYLTMMQFSKQSANSRAIDELMSKTSGRFANKFSLLSGHNTNISTQTAVSNYRQFLNTGSDSIYGIERGFNNVQNINDKQRNFIINKLKRGLLPIIGGILEMREDADVNKSFEGLAPGGILHGDQLTPKNLSLASTTSVTDLSYKRFALTDRFESEFEKSTYRGVYRAIAQRFGEQKAIEENAGKNIEQAGDLRVTSAERQEMLKERAKEKEEIEERERTIDYQKESIKLLTEISDKKDGLPKNQVVKKSDGSIDWSKVLMMGGIAGTLLKEFDIPQLVGNMFKGFWDLVVKSPMTYNILQALTVGYLAKTALFKAVPFVLEKSSKFLTNPANILLVASAAGLIYNLNEAFNDFSEGNVSEGISDLVYSGILGLPLVGKLLKIIPGGGLKGIFSKLKGLSVPKLGGATFMLGAAAFLLDDINNAFDEKGNFSTGDFIKNLISGDSYFSAIGKYALIGLQTGGLKGALIGAILGPAIHWLFGQTEEYKAATESTNQKTIDLNKPLLSIEDQKKIDNLSNSDDKINETVRILSQNKSSGVFYHDPDSDDNATTLNRMELAKYRSKLKKTNETGSGPDDSFSQGNNRQEYVNFAGMINTDALGKFATNMITGALSAGTSAINGVKQLFDYGSSSSGYSGGLPSGIDIENGEIGSVSGYYESGNKSTTVGCDKNGGTSYGKHQFSSKQGSVKEFLEFVKGKSRRGKEFYDAMYSAVGGDWSKLNTGSTTGAPVNVWKKYMTDPALQKYEYEFNLNKKYYPAFNRLPNEVKQIVSGSRALQEALFSTVVQHGPGKPGSSGEGAIPIFTKSYRSGMTPEEYLNAIYEERKTRFPSSTPNERASVQRRLEKEKNLLISISDGSYKNAGLANSGVVTPFGSTFKGYPKITQEDLESWRTNGQIYWPADSNVITSPFGPRNVSGGSRQHMGIDIRAGENAPIRAVMGGEVEATSKSYGQIVIKHPGGWKSKYLHLNNFKVKKGDHIQPGDVIGGSGGIGKDGKTHYTPHLHLEMAKDGQIVDPEAVFYAMNKTGNVKGSYQPGVYKEDVPDASKLKSRIVQQNNTETGDDQMSALNNKLSELTNERERNKIEDMKRTYMLMRGRTSAPSFIPIPTTTEGTTVNSHGDVSVSTGDSTLDRLYEKAFSTVAAIINESVIVHTGAVALSS